MVERRRLFDRCTLGELFEGKLGLHSSITEMRIAQSLARDPEKRRGRGSYDIVCTRTSFDELGKTIWPVDRITFEHSELFLRFSSLTKDDQVYLLVAICSRLWPEKLDFGLEVASLEVDVQWGVQERSTRGIIANKKHTGDKGVCNIVLTLN